MLFDLTTAAGEAQAVHKYNDGHFVVFKKYANGHPVSKGYQKEELNTVVSSVGDDLDTYYSQCTFTKKNSRCIANLKNIGCAFVDIDYHNIIDNLKDIEEVENAEDLDEEFEAEEKPSVEQKLYKKFCLIAEQNNLPIPSYMVKSGRGYYLKWLFDKALDARELPRWQFLQSVIVNIFKKVGGDPNARDASRVLRVIGSRNSKVAPSNDENTNEASKVRIVCIDQEPRYNCDQSDGINRYNFDNLHERAIYRSYDDVPVEAQQKAKLVQAKVHKIDGEIYDEEFQKKVIDHIEEFVKRIDPNLSKRKNLLTLNWQRFLDLRDLVVLRKGVHIGSRDLTLFWMSTFLVHAGILNSTNFFSEVSALAEVFPKKDFDPIKSNYLMTLYSKLEMMQNKETVLYNGQNFTAVYTPKNAKLIDIFDITIEEQKSLSTIINACEKLRRSDEKVPGRAERREKKIQWRKDAKVLAESAIQNGNQPCITEIAKKVGICKSQVSKLFNKKIGGTRKIYTFKNEKKSIFHSLVKGNKNEINGQKNEYLKNEINSVEFNNYETILNHSEGLLPMSINDNSINTNDVVKVYLSNEDKQVHSGVKSESNSIVTCEQTIEENIQMETGIMTSSNTNSGTGTMINGHVIQAYPDGTIDSKSDDVNGHVQATCADFSGSGVSNFSLSREEDVKKDNQEKGRGGLFFAQLIKKAPDQKARDKTDAINVNSLNIESNKIINGSDKFNQVLKNSIVKTSGQLSSQSIWSTLVKKSTIVSQLPVIKPVLKLDDMTDDQRNEEIQKLVIEAGIKFANIKEEENIRRRNDELNEKLIIERIQSNRQLQIEKLRSVIGNENSTVRTNEIKKPIVNTVNELTQEQKEAIHKKYRDMATDLRNERARNAIISKEIDKKLEQERLKKEADAIEFSAMCKESNLEYLDPLNNLNKLREIARKKKEAIALRNAMAQAA